jgi:hypothetical protein
MGNGWRLVGRTDEDAPVFARPHAPWGMDLSGHCGCDDCNAPDDIDEREPDADAVYDMGHDCREEMVETESHPTRSGRITVTEECGLCGRVLRTYTDSVL